MPRAVSYFGHVSLLCSPSQLCALVLPASTVGGPVAVGQEPELWRAGERRRQVARLRRWGPQCGALASAHPFSRTPPFQQLGALPVGRPGDAERTLPDLGLCLCRCCESHVWGGDRKTHTGWTYASSLRLTLSMAPPPHTRPPQGP